MLRLIDANSYVRRVVEKDQSGLVVRSFLAQVRPDDVYVWDGPDALRWRRELYPKYKVGRQPATESVYASLDLIRECLRHTAAVQIRVPGWEADDTLATLARLSGERVTVETCDWDLKQLEDEDVFVNVKQPKALPFEVPPRSIRLFKTLVGDVSDKISGVPGFGPKAWQAEQIGYWLDLILMLERGVSINQVERHVQTMPTRERFRKWLSLEPDRAELLAMWKGVGRADVPMETVEAHLEAGVPDRAKIEDLLREHLQ